LFVASPDNLMMRMMEQRHRLVECILLLRPHLKHVYTMLVCRIVVLFPTVIYFGLDLILSPIVAIMIGQRLNCPKCSPLVFLPANICHHDVEIKLALDPIFKRWITAPFIIYGPRHHQCRECASSTMFYEAHGFAGNLNSIN